MINTSPLSFNKKYIANKILILGTLLWCTKCKTKPVVNKQKNHLVKIEK